MKTHLHKLYGGISKEKRYGQVGVFLQENIFIDFPPKFFSYFFSFMFFFYCCSVTVLPISPHRIFSQCVFLVRGGFSVHVDSQIFPLQVSCYNVDQDLTAWASFCSHCG